MLSNFCSCHWQLQKVQNIMKTEPVKWQPKHVSLIAGSRCHEAPTLPRVAWVSTRLPTQVSAFQNRVKEFNFTRLTPHVSRWHCNAPAILVGVLLQSPPFSAGVHQTNVTSLSCLPTGPFSPGQEKKKSPKEKLCCTITELWKEIMAPLTHPLTTALAPTEVHIKRKKKNTILIINPSFPLLKFPSGEGGSNTLPSGIL